MDQNNWKMILHYGVSMEPTDEAVEFMQRKCGSLTAWDETYSVRPRICDIVIEETPEIRPLFVGYAEIDNNDRLRIVSHDLDNEFPATKTTVLENWKLYAVHDNKLIAELSNSPV